ncbi:hypothetical protein TcG_13057, partial [Trypanosoma cruzi]
VVAAGVVCLRCVDAVSWCVNCAAGPAALSSCCLRSLSLYSLCSVPLPLVAFFSLFITDQLTPATLRHVTMIAMVTVWRHVVSCALVLLLLLVRVCDDCWESWRCIWCCGCGGCAGGCVVCSE